MSNELKVPDNLTTQQMADWLVIPSFPRYEVNLDGQIRNKQTGYILTQRLTKYGYLGTRIMQDTGIVNNVRIHRIIAEVFIPNPEGKPYINHINGNKIDNRVQNLEWCTAQENTVHAFKTGLFPSTRRKKTDQEKVLIGQRRMIPQSKVDEIISMRKQGKVIREIAAQVGVSPFTCKKYICEIIFNGIKRR